MVLGFTYKCDNLPVFVIWNDFESDNLGLIHFQSVYQLTMPDNISFEYPHQ